MKSRTYVVNNTVKRIKKESHELERDNSDSLVRAAHWWHNMGSPYTFYLKLLFWSCSPSLYPRLDPNWRSLEIELCWIITKLQQIIISQHAGCSVYHMSHCASYILIFRFHKNKIFLPDKNANSKFSLVVVAPFLCLRSFV